MAVEDADRATATADYARRFEGGVGAFFLDLQAHLTRDLVAPWPGATVLDVGGGHGQLALPLRRAGHPVTVLGSAPDACAEGLREAIRAGEVAFAAGELARAPFPDRAFDLVLAFRLLPHARRFEALVAELCRLARQAVVVDYPTTRSVNAVAEALFALKKGVERNTRPFRVFREAEVRDAFATRGFHPTGRRGQFLLPMALHRALGLPGASRLLEGSAAGLGLTTALGSPVIARFSPREPSREAAR